GGVGWRRIRCGGAAGAAAGAAPAPAVPRRRAPRGKNRAMALSIRNLDAALGAEISGIDVSKPVPQPDIDAIEATWRERLVVVFHGQTLSDPQLIAFRRHFGEVDPPGPNPHGQPFLKDHPELNAISNSVENGKPMRKLR